MSRVYTCEEIRTACQALSSLSKGVPIRPGGDEPADDDIAEAQEASLSALRIIRTGLREIETEHSRLNKESS